MKILIFLFILISAQAQADNAFKSYLLNKEGVQLYKEQNYTSAFDKFVQAMTSTPFSPELQVNLGLAFNGLGKGEDAMSSYNSALKMKGSDISQFAAFFNLGEMMGRAKKVDEALVYYQEALKIKPDSKETKTNIELLIQQQQSGGGGSDDQKDKNKDQKDKDGKGKGDQDKKDGKDPDKDKDKDKDKEKDGKEYAKNKPQPQKFKSENLSPGDANKILSEMRQQEDKIRAEFNRRDVKEKPRDKDW